MPALKVRCFRKFMSTVLILIEVGFGLPLAVKVKAVKNRIPSLFDLVFDSQVAERFKENC